MDILLQGGTGRTTVILCEAGSSYEAIARDVFARLEKVSKVLLIGCSEITENSWKALGEKCLTLLTDQKVRQASFITFGSAATLSQYGYLKNPKLVRTMFLIDGAARPHPSTWERFVDWLEERFPLGLPLRGESKNFNARSHLQRMRCPVLCATTAAADEFIRGQAHAFASMIPTSWWCDLPSAYPAQNEVEVLTQLADQFQEIPAKCPQ